MNVRSRIGPPFLASAALALATTLCACGLDRAPLTERVTPVQAAPSPVYVPTALPDSLRCVSDPLEEGTGTDVLRVDMWRAQDGAFTASVQRGPQFWSHGGRWFGSDGEEWPASVERTLVEETKAGLVERSKAGTLTIALERQDGFFTGHFVDAQCYVHIETKLTCWNDLELFGSPWAGIAGSLEARFDWMTDECESAEGQPARNSLPLEIVRETGFAECTSLTGRLNGDDLGYPDLVGWNLAGANLDGAELFFADLTSATLNGADLSALEFGYATVSGSFDESTVRPEQGECSEVESPWGGTSLECVR